MTLPDSGKLRELVDAATPGPWAWTHHERGPWQVGTVVDEEEHPVGGYVDFSDLDEDGLTLVDFICEGGEADPQTAELIALAPALAARVLELETALRFYAESQFDDNGDIARAVLDREPDA